MLLLLFLEVLTCLSAMNPRGMRKMKEAPPVDQTLRDILQLPECQTEQCKALKFNYSLGLNRMDLLEKHYEVGGYKHADLANIIWNETSLVLKDYMFPFMKDGLEMARRSKSSLEKLHKAVYERAGDDDVMLVRSAYNYIYDASALPYLPDEELAELSENLYRARTKSHLEPSSEYQNQTIYIPSDDDDGLKLFDRLNPRTVFAISAASLKRFGATFAAAIFADYILPAYVGSYMMTPREGRLVRDMLTVNDRDYSDYIFHALHVLHLYYENFEERNREVSKFKRFMESCGLRMNKFNTMIPANFSLSASRYKQEACIPSLLCVAKQLGLDPEVLFKRLRTWPNAQNIHFPNLTCLTRPSSTLNVFWISYNFTYKKQRATIAKGSRKVTFEENDDCLNWKRVWFFGQLPHFVEPQGGEEEPEIVASSLTRPIKLIASAQTVSLKRTAEQDPLRDNKRIRILAPSTESFSANTALGRTQLPSADSPIHGQNFHMFAPRIYQLPLQTRPPPSAQLQRQPEPIVISLLDDEEDEVLAEK